MRQSTVVLLLGILLANPVAGQTTETVDTTSAKPVSWSLLPIVFSSPDTDWAFGLLPQVVFKMPDADRQSRVFVAAYYTLKSQYSVSTEASFWFNQDKDHIQFTAESKYWPTTFYGLASWNSTLDFESSEFTEQRFSASLSASRQMGQTFRLGLKASVQKTTLSDFMLIAAPQSTLHTPGEEGGWIVGLGPSIGLDTRDQVFYPTSGLKIELATLLYGHVLGGDYDFLSLQGDFRTYRNIYRNHVLAVQALFDLKSEDVPFWNMKGIGSAVRGFPSLRFLDSQLVAGGVEYRMHPLIWRIGIAGFVGAGVVARRVDDLPSSRIRWASGLGLRFSFMRDAKINIRWDFGWGEGLSGDYLDMGEAF